MMTFVTLKILEGLERGIVHSRLPLPVTVGRESDSDVQLNDDRVSRAHAKLQDHAGRVILTDLGSTNGTRVNGHPIQMRVMQHGDVIVIGRCVLVFCQSNNDDPLPDLDDSRKTVQDPLKGPDGDSMSGCVGVDEPGILFPRGRPPIPTDLSGLQRVQLSDLLSYIHEQLEVVVRGGVEELHDTHVRAIKCDWNTWTHLTTLASELSQDLRAVNNPED
jgi:hypothetical protein